MLRHVASAIAPALLLACAPPPAPDGALDIQIVFPPQSDPEQEGPYRVAPSTDGDYHLLIVVDVAGIVLRNPYGEVGGPLSSDPSPGVPEGEGHWHLEVNKTGESPSAFETWIEHVIPAREVDGEEDLSLTVTMRDNEHEPRMLDGDPVEDTVEVRLVAE